MGIVDFNTIAWNKKWIRELSSDAKVLFFYLWTNDHKNMIALYEIDIDKIAFELGMKPKKVMDTLPVLSPKVLYDNEKHIAWVVNHFRHQFMRTDKISPKILEGAKKCLISMKGHHFVGKFLETYKSLDLFNSDIPYPYTIMEGYSYPPGEVKGEGKGKGKEEKGDARGKGEAIPLPKDFGISDAVRQWAIEKGYNRLEERLEHFIDWAKAGRDGEKRYADWDATFRNAIRGDYAKLNTSRKEDDKNAF